MAEDVIIRYRAEVDEFIKDLERIAKEQEDIIDLEKESSSETKKAITSQQVAAQKRLELLKKEQQALEILKKQRELAFDPKRIKELNTAIAASESKIKLLKNTSQRELGATAGYIKSFAQGAISALGVVFSIDAIIRFGKASIDAFLEAEKNAQRLKFAITSIGGETEEVFNRLISQSQQLQKTTIFSDDSIQSAQAALSAFGLTGDEIERLIPKLADFASVTGTDIAQAAQQVGAGLEGAGREFKKYGIEVSATASRQDNLNNIMAGFSKFAGSAEEATKTLSGQLQVMQNRSDELVESIGSKLAPSFVALKVAVLEAIESLITYGNTAQKLREGKNQEGRIVGSKLIADLKEEGKTYEDIALSITAYVAVLEKEIVTLELDRQLRVRKQLLTVAESNEILQQIEYRKGLIEGMKDANTEESKAIDLAKKTTKASEDRNQSNDVETKTVKRLAAAYKELFVILNDKDAITGEDLDKIRLLELSISSEDIEEFRIKVAELVEKNKIEIPVTLVSSSPTDNNIAGLPTLPEFPIAEFINKNQEIIDASQDLVNELTLLYNTLLQNQISAIEKEKEARLESIDTALNANAAALEKRRISETEASITEKKLLDQKTKAEADAAKKENEIKKKQFNLDKTAALLQITINTAQAVSKALTAGVAGIPIAYLLGALGLAQGAVVLAQANPYKKGTKGAKSGIALVDEEGQELIGRGKSGRITTLEKGDKVLPVARANRYGEVIDAMFDNRLNDYIIKNYVNPALMKERGRREQNKPNSFTENIAKSIVYNTIQGTKGDHYLQQMAKGGVYMKNVDELARAMNSLQRQDIYKR